MVVTRLEHELALSQDQIRALLAERDEAQDAVSAAQSDAHKAAEFGHELLSEIQRLE